MEAHQGQNLTEVRVGSLDKNSVKAVNIVNGFKNDYLYPLSVTFTFDEENKETYEFYKTSSGNLILAQMRFFLRWQP